MTRLRAAGAQFETGLSADPTIDSSVGMVRAMVMIVGRIVSALEALTAKLPDTAPSDGRRLGEQLTLAKTAGHHANRLAEVLERHTPSGEDAAVFFVAALWDRRAELNRLVMALNTACDLAGNSDSISPNQINAATQTFRTAGKDLWQLVDKVGRVFARRRLEAGHRRAREAREEAARVKRVAAEERARLENDAAARRRFDAERRRRLEAQGESRRGPWGGGWY